MRIYLAARYHRLDEMRHYADDLRRHGHRVTSRWLQGHHPTSGSIDDPSWAIIAQEDVEDVLAADAVISFAEPERGGAGGRHVEFGMGLAGTKRLLVVGQAEHLFHTLTSVEVYATWPEALEALPPESS